MIAPIARQVKAVAHVGGLTIDDTVADRIATAIGPAFEGFSPVAGTLPFDLEPATFLVVQNAKAEK